MNPYQPNQPQYQPQPNQPGYQQPFPRQVVTRRKMNPVEHLFHAVMTLFTCGLWGFVWWARIRARTSVTTYR